MFVDRPSAFAAIAHRQVDPVARKGRSSNPALPIVRLYLAAAYALKGEPERAAAELAEARRLGGGDRFSSIASTKAVGFYGVPKVHALYETTVFAGLRKAGVPEE